MFIGTGLNIGKVDFIAAMPTPLDRSISFVRGFNGFPAFEFKKGANIREYSRVEVNAVLDGKFGCI